MSNILGINARNLPSPIGQFIQITVLKKMEHGDFYTCYTGVVPDTSLTNPNYQNEAAEWIMPNGNRISFEEAKGHFPGQLEEERYYSR